VLECPRPNLSQQRELRADFSNHYPGLVLGLLNHQFLSETRRGRTLSVGSARLIVPRFAIRQRLPFDQPGEFEPRRCLDTLRDRFRARFARRSVHC